MIIYFETPTKRIEKLNTQNERFKIKEFRNHFTIREIGDQTKEVFKYKLFKNKIIKIER